MKKRVGIRRTVCLLGILCVALLALSSEETRTRSLDTMPFGSSLRLDMEVWSWSDVDMGYGVGVYWYGFADTTSNRKPEPVEVLNVPPLPNLDR